MPFKNGESGNPKGRPFGSENKLTQKAKYLLNKLYDELDRIGVGKIAKKSGPIDLIRAIQAGLPKDLNINHSGEVEHKLDLSKLSKKQLEQLANIYKSLNQ